MKKYAGIGSRRTPPEVISLMHTISKALDKKGWTLRSGGAIGADQAFEKYATKKEIYLPWKGYQGSDSSLYNISKEAYELAESHHPVWNQLSAGVKKLIARNGYQILGENLNDPVNFVICYTVDGKASGGTGQAIRIAYDWKIPVYNLYDKDNIKLLLNTMKYGEEAEPGYLKGD